MTTIYVLVAYQASGETQCRGQRMEEWGSDVRVHLVTTPGEAAAKLADYRFENLKPPGSGRWDTLLLVNGYPMDIGDFWVEDRIDHDDQDVLDRHHEVMRLSDERLVVLKREQRIADVKLARHAQYLELKKEFGS